MNAKQSPSQARGRTHAPSWPRALAALALVAALSSGPGAGASMDGARGVVEGGPGESQPSSEPQTVFSSPDPDSYVVVLPSSSWTCGSADAQTGVFWLRVSDSTGSPCYYANFARFEPSGYTAVHALTVPGQPFARATLSASVDDLYVGDNCHHADGDYQLKITFGYGSDVAGFGTIGEKDSATLLNYVGRGIPSERQYSDSLQLELRNGYHYDFWAQVWLQSAFGCSPRIDYGAMSMSLTYTLD